MKKTYMRPDATKTGRDRWVKSNEQAPDPKEPQENKHKKKKKDS